jgi:hypothetical protein
MRVSRSDADMSVELVDQDGLCWYCCCVSFDVLSS